MRRVFDYHISQAAQRSTVTDVHRCPANPFRNSKVDVTRRISFGNTIMIFGYPSRGGIIILDDASPTDLEFLALDRMDPPLFRHEKSEEEDAFCQRLLLLGAKWWDSTTRYWLLNGEEVDIPALDESGEPEPTKREGHWVSVAWPSGGGLVVSEVVDTSMWGVYSEEGTVPDDVGRLRLCMSMDEKAQMLKNRFRGKVWACVEDYQGDAFLGCWETKQTGEVGELQKTWPEI